MPKSLFDTLYSTDIPAYLTDESAYICLVSQRKTSGTFSEYRDGTQAGMSDSFNSLPTQADFTESGTGLFMSKSQVITAEHVVGSGPTKFKVYHRKSTYTVSGAKASGDFASLTVDTRKSPLKGLDFSPVRFYSGAVPAVGSAVYALGYPYCCTDLRFFEGRITSQQESTVTTSLPAVVGCSGSPVFVESRGGMFVLGVVSFGPTQEVNLFNGTTPPPTSTVSLAQ